MLAYEEFVALLELLEDAADVLDMRAAKGAEADAATLSFSEAKKALGLD